MAAFSSFLLETFGIDGSTAGLCLLFFPLGRGISSAFYGNLFVDKGFGIICFEFIGVFCTSLGCLSLYMFNFVAVSRTSLILFEVVLFMVGCSCAATSSTFIPTITEVYSSKSQNPNANVTSYAAAMYMICTGLVFFLEIYFWRHFKSFTGILQFDFSHMLPGSVNGNHQCCVF